MKKITLFLGLFFLVGPSLFAHQSSLSVWVHEDAGGAVTFAEIMTMETEVFVPAGPSLSFGNSRSTWRLRIRVEGSGMESEEAYLTIHNPTVAKAALHVPVRQDGEVHYVELGTGWYRRHLRQDESFIYPAFRLPEKTDFTQDLYIQLYSPFTQNYYIRLLTQEGFRNLWTSTWFFLGLSLGVYLAMLVYNFILFIGLRDKAYFYYLLFAIFLLAYQTTFLGVLQALLPGLAGVFSQGGLINALAMIVAAIFFVRAFFDTRIHVPGRDRWLRWHIPFAVVGVVLLLLGRPFLANAFVHLYAVLGALLSLEVAWNAQKNGYRQARVFLAGWITLLTGVGTAVGRYLGWLPNTNWTSYYTVGAVSMFSILMSVALAVRMRQISVERQIVATKYEAAARSSRSHELAFLRAQIKPHFVFNAINTISNLIVQDPTRAQELLLDFSDYMRGSFQFDGTEETQTLAEELATVKAYLAMEKARFGERLQVVYDIQVSPSIRIPQLCIQPLVENAVCHGLMQKQEGGTVRISALWSEGAIIISVQDDGVGMTQEMVEGLFDAKPRAGVGIRNIFTRLTHYYGYGVRLFSEPNEGTVVELIIDNVSNLEISTG